MVNIIIIILIIIIIKITIIIISVNNNKYIIQNKFDIVVTVCCISISLNLVNGTVNFEERLLICMAMVYLIFIY
jgi:hypothetical protein